MSPLVFGAIASSGLLVGAVLGAYLDVPSRAVGVTLAFSGGALITALAFDLFEDAFATGGPLLAGAGLLVGAVVFSVTDWLLDVYVGGEESTGLALLASVTLDGVPENAALGVAIAGAGGGSPLALLAAIFASNFPEALDGADYIVRDGRSPRYAISLWLVVAVVLAVTVPASSAMIGGLGERALALVRSFAGGAVVASIADEILPDAYEEGGPVIGLATAAGFFLTFLLK